MLIKAVEGTKKINEKFLKEIRELTGGTIKEEITSNISSEIRELRENMDINLKHCESTLTSIYSAVAQYEIDEILKG